MSKGPDGGNGHRRRRLVARVKAQGLPCALCGQPIDYSLDWRDPMAFVLDERLPRALGGSGIDPANVQPAHRCCNERKGKMLAPVFAAPGVLVEDVARGARETSAVRSRAECKPSRDWGAG